jgi:hypothetical protein
VRNALQLLKKLLWLVSFHPTQQDLGAAIDRLHRAISILERQMLGR